MGKKTTLALLVAMVSLFLILLWPAAVPPAHPNPEMPPQALPVVLMPRSPGRQQKPLQLLST